MSYILYSISNSVIEMHGIYEKQSDVIKQMAFLKQSDLKVPTSIETIMKDIKKDKYRNKWSLDSCDGHFYIEQCDVEPDYSGM